MQHAAIWLVRVLTAPLTPALIPFTWMLLRDVFEARALALGLEPMTLVFGVLAPLATAFLIYAELRQPESQAAADSG